MAEDKILTMTTLFSIVLFFLIVGIAIMTKIWVVTALVIGFLFGFFLEKSDLCGASAFSEIVMMRDWRKLFGIWIVIVTSMLGFSLLHLADFINLNPKPLTWASYIVGGIVFGIGMVLAGGCVSGTLFKTGQGNINSMAGLVGIPLGIALIEYGPLHSIHLFLKKQIIHNATGGSVTISSLTGLPYPVLAVGITAITVGIVFVKKRKEKPDQSTPVNYSLQKALTSRWKPWQSGIAIGLLACFAYLSSAASGRNYPLGVTHGVLHAQLLLTDSPLIHKWQKTVPKETNKLSTPDTKEAQKPTKKVHWWLILEILSLILGAHVSARLSGKGKLQARPPDETVIAFFGGTLVGAGAALAGGCVIGNIMSGWALMSVGNILFGVTVLLSNWATTYFYLMGGQRAT